MWKKYCIGISEYINALEITIHSQILFILKCHLWKYSKVKTEQEDKRPLSSQHLVSFIYIILVVYILYRNTNLYY